VQLTACLDNSLEDNVFTVNPFKCKWTVQETNWWLGGHWLTPNGLKLWKKIVDAILQLQPPDTMKQICSFIGSVNYYGNMFPCCAHHLALLTKLTGKGPFVWTSKQQQALYIMKSTMIHDCLLRYPDHNKGFQILTQVTIN
jgi:hypothetical protein